ncbi:capsular polysaccharide biosynthesis protein [Yoonia vestfoldensis]|uniref:capsular polysaccharide biosynthesis protein n=1 Tax=Yoonia vestfoldensis TaxID=245188 RepID=UPI0013A57138|nr:capsular polysaccharide biosynthesis protein [Yoonia vestfoldensis]
MRTLPIWLYEAIRATRADGVTAYACTSLAMTRSAGLAIALGARPIFHSRLLPLRASHVVGWGRRWSGLRATRLAAGTATTAWLVEDGFVRSVGRFDTSLSYLIDRQGVHYDADHPSDFEDLAKLPLTAAARSRARNVARVWRRLDISKYNDQRDGAMDFGVPYVLVIDQTFGDASIAYGRADAQSFQQMLAAALDENPDHLVVVKTHPDTASRKRKGYFDIRALQRHDRIRLITAPCHPVGLIVRAAAVYTVTSQIGFEALIRQKRVRTFGMPFYAGWGLTDDALAPPVRRQPISLDQLVYAALIAYPRYVDPMRKQRCEAEQALAHVGLQRRHRTALPPDVQALGFSRWKRRFVARFLQGSQVVFRNKPPAKPQAVALWGSAAPPSLPADTAVIRLEDGFLRSSGLGADLVQPLSLVVDDIGIYYDATRPSRLEQMLSTQVLTDPDRSRARALRQKLVALDVTKYNLGRAFRARSATGRQVLLVIGQVETDASIRFGSPEITSNIALLRRVRAENPCAWIVYKPHPDVLAGLRRQGVDEDSAATIADETVTDPVSLNSLLSGVDEVHTMTSLLGFEALIRGKTVICHGLPFYAGWGLTRDRLTCTRRTGRPTLDELVYATLIAYPRYFSHDHRCFIEPEDAVDQLVRLAAAGPTTRRWYRKLMRAGLLGWLRLVGSQR